MTSTTTSPGATSRGGTWVLGPDAGDATRVVPATVTCAACAAERARALTGPGGSATVITSPARAAAVLAPVLAERDRERCAVVLLDTRHVVLDIELVSIGSLDHTFMSPREVYRDALLGNAAALVVGHNHPSGDPTPSEDDIAVTSRLARSGEIVGVDLLDHLVVAGSRWRSLARAGHV